MSPEEVPGPLPSEIGHLLAHYASQVPTERAIVEVGSYLGRSTCFLAWGASRGEGAHVWAVDPWDLPGNKDAKRHPFTATATRTSFGEHVAACGFADRVTPVQAFSTAAAVAWDGPRIGLLYIDAVHTYEAVKADFEAWTPHLTDGAVVAFDDANTSRFGVGRFAREIGAEFHCDTRLAVWRSKVAA